MRCAAFRQRSVPHRRVLGILLARGRRHLEEAWWSSGDTPRPDGVSDSAATTAGTDRNYRTVGAPATGHAATARRRPVRRMAVSTAPLLSMIDDLDELQASHPFLTTAPRQNRDHPDKSRTPWGVNVWVVPELAGWSRFGNENMALSGPPRHCCAKVVAQCLGGRKGGAWSGWEQCRGSFIASMTDLVDRFYAEVVQALRPWTPPAPQMGKPEQASTETTAMSSQDGSDNQDDTANHPRDHNHSVTLALRRAGSGARRAAV